MINVYRIPRLMFLRENCKKKTDFNFTVFHIVQTNSRTGHWQFSQLFLLPILAITVTHESYLQKC